MGTEKVRASILIAGDADDIAVQLQHRLAQSGLDVEVECCRPTHLFDVALQERNRHVLILNADLFDSAGKFEGTLVHALPPDTVLLAIGAPSDTQSIVQCIKAGARDFVDRHNLAQLTEAIKQALPAVEPATLDDTVECGVAGWSLDEQAMSQAGSSYMPASARLDRNGIYEFVDEEYAAVFGRRRDELIGQRWLVTVATEDQQTALQAYNQMLENGRSERQIAGVRKDGTTFATQILMIERVDADGDFDGHYCFVQDATERDRTAKQLADSEARLRTIFDSEPECIKLLDRSCCLLDMNPAGLEMIQAESIEQVRGANVLDIVASDYRDYFQKANEATFAGEEHAVLEFEIVGLQGARKWMESIQVPFRDAEGNILSSLSVTRDATRRKEAENALRTSNARYQGLLQNHVDAITLTVDGRFTYTNARLTELTGYSPEEARGQSPFDYLVPEDRSRLAERLSTVGTQTRWPATEYRMLHKDGSVVYVEVQSCLIPGESKPTILSVIRDLTETKAVQEKLRKREAELAHVSRLTTMGELATGLAHELNQPLTAISGYAGICSTLLDGPSPDLNRVRDYLEELTSATLRAGDIVRRIRSMVGPSRTEYANINLNDVVRDSIGMATFDFRHQDVDCHVQLPDDVPDTRADEIQLQQVILNLIRNALEAMQGKDRDDRHLTIATSFNGTEIEIAVADTGHGLLTESADEMFETFYSTKSDGLGVGLQICRTIVENHHGKISAVQNSEGGMTFRVCLPVSAMEAGHAA